MPKREHQALSPSDWEKLPDEQLLTLRVRDLGLQIEQTRLERNVRRLYSELGAKGMGFHPHCYLADEWLTPDRVPVIGIPFYLAHPRLKQLERKMMLEVEGGTDAWCMKLLRHEAGHAMNYAYLLFKRTRWGELFGRISSRYTDTYSAKPYSKRYVNHLQDNYAQAHPDEDFAETFAVWLTPDNDWRERYRGWYALKKLRYLDHLMSEVGPKAPRVTTRQTPWSAARMTSTLKGYYQRRRRYLGEDFPGFYDPGLRRLFTTETTADSSHRGSRFLRNWRKEIINSATMWTGGRKYDADRLIRKLIKRCDALGLYVRKPEAETLAEASAFVTAAMNRIHQFLKRPENE